MLRSRLLMLVSIALLVAAAVALCAPALWARPAFRAQVASWALSVGSPQVAMEALEDPNPDIALAGCKTLHGLDVADRRDLFLRRLATTDEPALADCLLGGLEAGGGRSRAGDADPRLGLMAERWATRLEALAFAPAGPGDRKTACGLAGKLRHAARLEEAPPDSALLHCALASPVEELRACCSREMNQLLADGDLAEVLPSSLTFGAAHPELFAGLLRSIRGGADGARLEIALDTRSGEAWALRAACAGLDVSDGATRDALAEELVTFTTDESCATPAPKEEALDAWIAGCHQGLAGFRLDRRPGDGRGRGEPGRAVCQAVRASLETRAKGNALADAVRAVDDATITAEHVARDPFLMWYWRTRRREAQGIEALLVDCIIPPMRPPAGAKIKEYRSRVHEAIEILDEASSN